MVAVDVESFHHGAWWRSMAVGSATATSTFGAATTGRLSLQRRDTNRDQADQDGRGCQSERSFLHRRLTF